MFLSKNFKSIFLVTLLCCANFSSAFGMALVKDQWKLNIESKGIVSIHPSQVVQFLKNNGFDLEEEWKKLEFDAIEELKYRKKNGMKGEVFSDTSVVEKLLENCSDKLEKFHSKLSFVFDRYIFELTYGKSRIRKWTGGLLGPGPRINQENFNKFKGITSLNILLKELGFRCSDKNVEKVTVSLSVLNNNELEKKSCLVKNFVQDIVKGIFSIILPYFDKDYLKNRIKNSDQHIYSYPYIPIFLQKVGENKIKIFGFPSIRQDLLEKYVNVEPDLEKGEIGKSKAFFWIFISLFSHFHAPINQLADKYFPGKNLSEITEMQKALETLELPADTTDFKLIGIVPRLQISKVR